MHCTWQRPSFCYKFWYGTIISFALVLSVCVGNGSQLFAYSYMCVCVFVCMYSHFSHSRVRSEQQDRLELLQRCLCRLWGCHYTTFIKWLK